MAIKHAYTGDGDPSPAFPDAVLVFGLGVRLVHHGLG